MLEVCPGGCSDSEHRQSRSLACGHHPLATRRLPLRALVKTSGSSPFQYQNTIESAYGLLPRPPQTPAAPFKRLYRK